MLNGLGDVALVLVIVVTVVAGILEDLSADGADLRKGRLSLSAVSG